MKGRSSSNERQKFGASLPDNRSQTAADLTSFNSRPFSPPPSSIIIESSGKNEDGEASERGRRRRGGRQRKGRRGERWSRNRYGIGSSVFAAENQKGVALILLGERRQTSTTIADRDNETMEWVALAADSDYRARFLEAETEKRERRTDPRRTAAPLSIMRSCTRNYAPRFSGIAKNSRRCTETGAAPLCAVLRVLRHCRRLARFSFISFRHHPPPSSHRIINVTKPGLVDALCIQAPTLGANGIISRRVYLASIESVFN